MTIDNMMPEDIERIFGRRTPETLQEISLDMGDDVLGIWIESGVEEAKKNNILHYEIPSYLESYIKHRYNVYKNGKPTKERMTREEIIDKLPHTD